MAISNTIQSMYNNVDSAYTSLSNKGATIPADKNLANLANTIDSIPAGSGAEVVKGLADGSLTEFKASNYGVTSLAYRRFYQFTSLTSLDLTGVTVVPEYTACQCTSLSSLTIGSNTTSIGQYAFYQCNNANLAIDLDMSGQVGNYAFSSARIKSVTGTYTLIGNQAFYSQPYSNPTMSLTSVNIKVNGEIQSEAFRYQRNVQNFVLDPTSNITNIGSNAFAQMGLNRTNPSSNVFVFDFRNSTFTSISNEIFCGASSAQKTSYFDIYFPSTLIDLKAQSYAQFEYIDYFNIYYKSIPTTNTARVFGSYATNYKNFFPYNLAQTAKTATNWTQYASSIYGYAEENTFSLGDVLPIIDSDGYELTWYSDIAMTTQVTTVADPTQIYYCAVGARVAIPLTITELHATCTISDVTNTYSNGDLVPVGATITITAAGETGYTTPYIFTLNGTTVSSGDTYTVQNTDTTLAIICIYYDGVNPPVEANFADNTPQQIKIAVDNGLHRTLWNIGDTKTITLTDNSQVTIRYIDQVANRYQKSDNSGYTNAVFEFTTLPMTAQMSVGNAVSWPASTMNMTTMPLIYALFDSDWQTVLSECKIGSATSSSDSTLVYANNKVFIPSGQEMFGEEFTGNWYFNELCSQFDYYRINSSASNKQKKYNGSETAYFLRSPYKSNQQYSCAVGANGGMSMQQAFRPFGVSVTFAI